MTWCGEDCLSAGGGRNVHYIEREGTEHYYTMDNYPELLDKKFKLLTYFQRYMNEHLVKAGGKVPVRECDVLSRIPYMNHWFRTSSAVFMQLTNGTVQINFTNHTKVILCPLMMAVTYIDAEKNFRTFRYSTIAEQGCCMQLGTNLKYALDKIQLTLSKREKQ
uniref:POLO box domain-containing protein n=1 Tax=Timema genevievae TaxID=629358 RepID=A0A7R9K3E0_TIMGE|nr:unnamed protein product [Timema genevievae]